MALFTSACGSSSTNVFVRELTPSQERCTVKVANNNFHDVEVSVLIAGTYMRLDRILAGDTKRIDIPTSMTGHRPRMLIKRVGAPRWFSTNEAYCSPGQELELWITADLYQSMLMEF
jgi:hypothetical protein